MALYAEIPATKLDQSRFAILGRVGEGGLAHLSRARDGDGNVVVIRQLHEHLRFNRHMRSCFVDGITARRKLGAHPNIVQYLGEGGALSPFEVIEFVPGDNISTLVNRRNDAVTEHRFRVLLDAAEALAHVHDCGFLHLDFKPENLLMDFQHPKRLTKLTDFDMTQPIEKAKAPHNWGGSMMYVPPEYLAHKAISRGTDFFAFGVFTYLLFTGEAPFVGSVESVIHRGKIDLRYPSQQGQPVPPEVREFIGYCLAPNPCERFGDDKFFLRMVHGLYRRYGRPQEPEDRPSPQEQTAELLRTEVLSRRGLRGEGSEYCGRRARVKRDCEVEIREESFPAPGPEGLLIEVAACALGARDLRQARRALDWSPVGLEACGTVRQIGPLVSDFKVGDRVALTSTVPCLECDTCIGGAPEHCENTKGFVGKYMGFADYLLCPQQCALPAADLPALYACLVEPLAAALDIAHGSELGPGDGVLIIGDQFDALMQIPACRQLGAQDIWWFGCDNVEVARQLGAEHIIVGRGLDDLLGYDFGSRRPQRVLCLGSPLFIGAATGIVAPGGSICYLDSVPNAAAASEAARGLTGEGAPYFVGAVPCPSRHAREALEMLEAAAFDPSVLVGSNFEIDRLPEALSALKDGRTSLKLIMANPASEWMQECL